MFSMVFFFYVYSTIAVTGYRDTVISFWYIYLNIERCMVLCLELF